VETTCHKLQYFDLIENLKNDFDIPQINKNTVQRQNISNRNTDKQKIGVSSMVTPILENDSNSVQNINVRNTVET
jgi:hypothetical protein